MKLSLLRRIWQRIVVDTSTAAPRQRLTGFEPLEPRMVLSGFIAHFDADYFSPPPGDFSEVERAGAEYARPIVEFGGYSDYNSLGRGNGNDNWLVGKSESPLKFSEKGEIDFGLDSGIGLDGGSGFDGGSITIIDIDTSTPDGGIGISIETLPVISELAVDRILSDMRSFSVTSLTTMTTTMSVSFRSLTDRDYTPVNSGAAVERNGDHEYAALTPAAADGSASTTTRQAAAAEIERGAMDAALAHQTASINPIAVPAADGSTVQGQANADANSGADQNGLVDLTEAERLKLKRKLPGSATEIEEAKSSTTDGGDQHESSEAQVTYELTRPFNPVAIPEGSMSPAAEVNFADDGMIEVLATDVTVALASGEVIAEAAANRQLVMDPAVATYQAFEVVVHDSAPAVDVAADAARLAGAVAMAGQPVVNAE